MPLIRTGEDLKYRVENLNFGIIDEIEGKSAPAGSAKRSLNWLTMGDRIEIRRGYQKLGTSGGTGKITGFHTSYDILGNEVLLRKNGRDLEYYDPDTSAWATVGNGSNIFPTAAENEDVAFTNITTQAGAQCWISSPNSGYFKVMINGGRSTKVAPHVKDNYDASVNHKGYIRANKNRITLWGKIGDPGGYRGSFIDERNYTTVSNEVLGAGNASTKTFSGTLSAVSGKRTVFGILIDAVVVGGATETFSDNRDGTLSSNLGGTGTINYSTGAFSITFNTAPDTAQNVLGDYQWEDSTNGGLADYTESGTRVAGEGFYLPQTSGGALQFVGTIKDIDYCMHRFITWFVEITQDDTNARNDIFREAAGIPNFKAAVATGEGIYYIDDRNESDVRLRLMTYDLASSEVIPLAKSDNVDFSGFNFDDAYMDEFGDFILIFCAETTSTDSDGNPANNRCIVYNRSWKSIDVLDYTGRGTGKYSGAFHIAGSLEKAVYEIFSGFDDDGSEIMNYWESNLDEMEIAELKKSARVRIEGDIQPAQTIEVYLSIDNGEYVLLGEIDGDGEYVDKSASVSVGSSVLGKNPIGGTGAAEIVEANHYVRELSVRRLIGKFQRASIKFRGIGVGYGSISSYEFTDITQHGSRVPGKYNTG